MSGGSFPAGIYLIKVSNKNTKTGCEICSKLTLKTVEQWQCQSGGFFCYLWTIFTQCSNIFIVEFEQADDNWVIYPTITLPTISASLSTVTFKTWCFNFRTSLAEECSDAVAYSDYKSCGKEARTVKNQTNKIDLFHFSTINKMLWINKAQIYCWSSSFLSYYAD